MEIRHENIWDSNVDVICVTTNGTVLPNGKNIMGGGIAKEALDRWENYPHYKSYNNNDRTTPLDFIYGQLILRKGLKLTGLPSMEKKILAFPTKYTINRNASLTLIQKSFNELKVYSDIFPELVIGLPKPGCTYGGLDWESQVKPLLESLWYPFYDERIIIFDYPQK